MSNVMAVPVLMTLFTDDAVEVRYSDQSCLQLSPCGSTFVHHESPGQLVHPAHGMKTISQRCEFVTSDYRQKVLHALDFRNRFAERPFLCQPLIEDDQIMALYARISSAAWPKGLEQANFEYMMDGGIRLISEDEYASIMLSPHRQDFTVCHLCGISSDKPRRRSNIKSQSHCLKKTVDAKTGSLKDKVREIPKTNTAELFLTKNDQAEILEREKSRHELNISPISFASTQMSRESSPINDSKIEVKRYSTPTNVFQNVRTQKCKGDLESLDGSFLQFAGNTNSQKHNSMESTLIENKNSNLSYTSKHSSDSDSSVTQKHVHWLSTGSSGSNESQTGSEEGSSNSCLLYTWVTKHFSCEECPASWKHVLNMARAAIDNREELEKYASATSVHITQKPKGIPKKINPEKYCMAPLPLPLPLTCPGQHLHRQYGKYIHDDDRDIVENITALSKGRLKIILIDGIVFRVVRMASTKFVEIYPGDGSVIISQGLGGHFYRHLISKGNELDERTYSLKALPPTTKTAAYSIEKLIKRASRFLLQSCQEDKSITDRTACWKYKDSTPIEPLSATLLEECSVPGHGRFSAFSNGHVRILFDDRTALDMACDFTKRIVSCMEHSNDENEKSTLQQQLDQHSSMESRSKQGLCKLLLPYGQYQIVDSYQPGIYKKYTDAALEWAAWVNSSPKQRKIFYQEWDQPDDATMMVTKELQKIKCFNYLADNTLTSTGSMESHQAGFSITGADSRIAPRNSSLHHSHYSIHSIPSNDSSSYITNVKGSTHGHLHATDRRTKSHYKAQHNPSKELEMMRGFDSVREALLKTSNAIKDIDEIIDKRGEKS